MTNGGFTQMNLKILTKAEKWKRWKKMCATISLRPFAGPQPLSGHRTSVNNSSTDRQANVLLAGDAESERSKRRCQRNQ